MVVTQPDLVASQQLHTTQTNNIPGMISVALLLAKYSNTCPREEGKKSSQAATVSLFLTREGRPRPRPENTQVLEARVGATCGCRGASGGPTLGGAFLLLAGLEQLPLFLSSAPRLPLAVLPPQVSCVPAAAAVTPALLFAFSVLLVGSFLCGAAVLPTTLNWASGAALLARPRSGLGAGPCGGLSAPALGALTKTCP